jgi:hypothetical protein
MSRPVLAKLAQFRSVFDEALIASTPSAVIKSNGIQTISAGVGNGTLSIGWSSVSSNIAGTSLGSASFPDPGFTVAVPDSTLYDGYGAFNVSTVTSSSVTVLSDGVYRISGNITASLTDQAGSSALLHLDLVINGTVSRRMASSPMAFDLITVPFEVVRPLTSATNIGINAVFANLGANDTTVTIAGYSAYTGAELYITREVTLVHLAMQ